MQKKKIKHILVFLSVTLLLNFPVVVSIMLFIMSLIVEPECCAHNERLTRVLALLIS